MLVNGDATPYPLYPLSATVCLKFAAQYMHHGTVLTHSPVTEELKTQVEFVPAFVISVRVKAFSLSSIKCGSSSCLVVNIINWNILSVYFIRSRVTYIQCVHACINVIHEVIMGDS